MSKHNNKLPEIRINFSMLLYKNECRLLDLHLNNGQSKMATPDEFIKKAKQYQKAWTPHEALLLREMVAILGVSFYRPVIDVTLAPYFRSKSTPLIINFQSSPDRFVDILTHELLHILLTDNNLYQSNSTNPKINLIFEWQQLFGKDHDRLVLAHIPVHALHKYLYINILREPERLYREMEAVKGSAYDEAWKYVNNYGYMEIIHMVRKIYQK